MKRVVSGLLLLVVVAVVVGYAAKRAWPLLRPRASSAVRIHARGERPANGTPAPVMAYADRARFQFAIYFLPRPTSDPKAALSRLLPGFPSLHLAARGAEPATVSPAALDIRSYEPPSAQLLKVSGVGLSPREVDALQRSKEVFGLDFTYRPADGFTVLRDAHLLLLRLAKETSGLIWDDSTRECFAPDAWGERRLRGWEAGLPHLPSHFTVHVYRNGDLLRAVSLGLGKFGLPDMAVNDLPESYANSMVGLINLACQTAGERGKLDAPGRLSVDVARLENARLRGSLQKSYLKGATGRADLAMQVGTRDEGDAENRLYEIVFPRPKETSLQEAQEVLTSTLFGAEDAIAYTDHDAELLAASDRAKAKLPALEKRFNKGLAPGERLLLKAPFRTKSGGTEWMWVEVVRWKGAAVEGVLQNDPFEVPELKAGARVQFEEALVFDFIDVQPDGRMEGNETGEIIGRREKAKAALGPPA